MLKDVLKTIKDAGKVVYSFIKNVSVFFCFLVKSIFGFIKYVFAIIKGFFIFIKSVVDFFYKLVFIVFVFVVGFTIYKIYNNASDINKKLDGVLSSVQSILNFTNKGNEFLDKIDTFSFLTNDKKEPKKNIKDEVIKSNKNKQDKQSIDCDNMCYESKKAKANDSDIENSNNILSNKQNIVSQQKFSGTNSSNTEQEKDNKLVSNKINHLKKYIVGKYQSLISWLKK